MIKGKIDKEVKELVLWRLETSVPEHFKLSAREKFFNKEELKKAVEEESEVGIAFVDMQLKFIKALTGGKFYKIPISE